MRLFYFIVIMIGLLISKKCEAQSDTVKYLFAGHTYQFYTHGEKVDTRLEDLDLSAYESIWLGGDVCSEALLEYTTLEYIDGLFNLNHPNSHWALGNHDARNANWNWLEELTGKKTYYTSHYKGISYMVLNTTLTPYDCEQLDDQYRILVNLCDTITESSHLIIILHHCLWEGVPGLPPPSQYAQSNLRYFSFNCYRPDVTFLNDIYPRLIEVKNRGIEVILIMGDMGSKKIDILSDDGIRFLGTGLNHSKYQDPEDLKNIPPDWMIEFHHLPEKKWLDWKFVDIDVMVENQN